MGAHFPSVELDNAIQFSTLSRMSGFLWRSSKWACQFGHFLPYTPGLEVLACSLNIDPNYVTTNTPTAPFLEPLSKVAATFRGNMQQLFGCILIDRYVTQAAKFSGKMHKLLRSLVEYLATLVFLCCHYIFDSYVTCLTLSFNTVYLSFHSH